MTSIKQLDLNSIPTGIVKLKGQDNWLNWEMHIRMAIEQFRLLPYIDKSDGGKPRESDLAAMEKWQDEEVYCRRLIVHHCDDAILHGIRDGGWVSSHTAYQTLEAIKKKCNAAPRVTFALMMEEMFTMKAETFATFGAFVRRLNLLWDQLNVVMPNQSKGWFIGAAINAIKNCMPLRYEDYMHRLADQKPPTKTEILAFFQSHADLIDNTKKDAFSADLSGSGTKTQDRGRGRGRGGRGRGRGGRGSQGGRPSSSSPSMIIGPDGRRGQYLDCGCFIPESSRPHTEDQCWKLHPELRPPPRSIDQPPYQQKQITASESITKAGQNYELIAASRCFIEISENTTLDPFRAADGGDLLP
ncbi:hypothetical protein L249_6029 [Ophiocordyceps polyrhachis-furcata BCC 54312]|uniref:Uncharacterized protein n=1 Tax=Ophiocordyceps polyrhachis-furcata BCC 54312 TaxID=1330021 RepID=A0A367LIW9_9HYPO|nr:hypothetical protein L249_6029 [Ophiocordyceps polyrhachis-furcata BCC 54312]